ncbi:hypothetical protein Ddye_010445 [Dipteronia dyeriana]|uniref:RPW8 domain-containing protein n=1 Tax=Dipteronia dyeriana TaxID=168575 RepID=A0AAD9XDI8_9ROSI|nr:hypothetical protein Ddye_010445 [Dipteronia dyeriana]
MEELDRSNQQHHANLYKEQIRVFTKQLEEGKELVKTCESIPIWNKNKKRKYTKTLTEVDSSLRANLVVGFEVINVRLA